VQRKGGFTLIELLVVLIIMGITLAVVATTLNRYLDRSAARRAAEIFGQDLMAARGAASRSRQRVVVDFDEGDLSYLVRVESGDTLINRSFGRDSDITLTFLDLELNGDTVAFNGRGVADLRGASGALARAFFTSGNTTYAVSFNSMGSSRIDER
jgi:prepilin-type N-terminal cleavage/methylation domain-containing protein